MILGLMLRDYRKANGIPLRRLAKSIGVDHSSLSRIERGQTCELRTFTKLLNWATYEQDTKNQTVE